MIHQKKSIDVSEKFFALWKMTFKKVLRIIVSSKLQIVSDTIAKLEIISALKNGRKLWMNICSKLILFTNNWIVSEWDGNVFLEKVPNLDTVEELN